METTAPATLLRRLSRQLQEASAPQSADRGQKVLATASSKKKLGVRNFPPDFLDPEAMETTAPATLPRRPLRQLQEVPAAELAAPGQMVWWTASSKKTSAIFPPVFWIWRQWKPRRWPRCHDRIFPRMVCFGKGTYWRRRRACCA